MAAFRSLRFFPALKINLFSDINKVKQMHLMKRAFCPNCRKLKHQCVTESVQHSSQIVNKLTHNYNCNRNFCVQKHVIENSLNKADKDFGYNSAHNHFINPLSCSHNITIQPLSFTDVQVRNFHQCHSSYISHNDIANTTLTTDPFKMMDVEMGDLMKALKEELKPEEPHLQFMSHYYFNVKGKTLRPLVTLLMARACNIHCSGSESITWQQKVVAMVSEMIHAATLIHDDVIDASDTRRNQTSLNALYGQRQAILTGDYILSQASIAVARTKNPRVISILGSILVELINGEFMQLGTKENENERFAHYFDKTYKKTASLIAKSCKSVAILGNCDDDVVEMSFQYGRNLGLAFQFIDDLLDFTSSDKDMGKPTVSDLKQGIATAPVLFAAQEFPELQAMIMRRFTQNGDVEFARNAVEKSKGVEQTRLLATKHSEEAVRNAQSLKDSEARAGLIYLAQILLERKR